MGHRYSYDNYPIEFTQDGDRWKAKLKDENHPWWQLNNKPDEPGMCLEGYGLTPGEAIEDLVGPKYGNGPRFLVLDLSDLKPEERARKLHYYFYQGWELTIVDQGVAYLERRGCAEHDSYDGGKKALLEIKRELERKRDG